MPGADAFLFEDVAPVVGAIMRTSVRCIGPVSEGGYSPAGRWLVEAADGGTAFVKAERETDDFGLSAERLVYTNVTAPFMARLIGYDDRAGVRVLVTEDLSDARWGVPLDYDDLIALSRAMDSLAEASPVAGLPTPSPCAYWRDVAASPNAAVATGLIDHGWIDRHAAALIEAEASVSLTGPGLVHRDLWRQNWCRADRGAVLVDWAWAATGNPMLSRAWAEAGVRAAGGLGGVVLPAGSPGWAAWAAGMTTAEVAKDSTGKPGRLVETERREAFACLRWVCDELRIDMPTGASRFAPPGPWRP